MRLFIALDFQSEQFILLQKSLKGFKGSFPSSFHCTLKFLGDVPEIKIPEIISILEQIEFPTFVIITSNMGFFPSKESPKVIWIGFQDQSKILELQQKIDNKLSQLFSNEQEFHPHITLARIKLLEDKEVLNNSLPKPLNKAYTIREFTLYSSELTSLGPIYKPLFKRQLA